MKYFRWTILLAILGAFACTDAECSKTFAYGDSATIKCFSGGEVIYEGASTGKVISEANSDGYFFKDAEDGRLKEVSGNCVITYE